MKAGFNQRGSVVPIGRRISKDGHLERNGSILSLAGELSTRSGTSETVVQRRMTFSSRAMQARATIQNVMGGGTGDASSSRRDSLFEKAQDPRTLARVEFQETQRLAREFQMDLREVKQILDIFFDADKDETGGLDKRELEGALARVLDVHVVPAADLEEAWRLMIGKRPLALERLLDEVEVD